MPTWPTHLWHYNWNRAHSQFLQCLWLFMLVTRILSRLALPAASKRRREGSLDLETGLDPKKSRGAPEPASNLVKSKSKSMMNIAGRPATVNPRFESFLWKLPSDRFQISEVGLDLVLVQLQPKARFHLLWIGCHQPQVFKQYHHSPLKSLLIFYFQLLTFYIQCRACKHCCSGQAVQW